MNESQDIRMNLVFLAVFFAYPLYLSVKMGMRPTKVWTPAKR